MQEFLKTFYNSKQSGWVLEVFTIVLVTLVAAWLVNRFLIKLKPRLEKSGSPLDDAFINSIIKPVRALIWLIGLFFAIEIIYFHTQTPIFSAVEPLREVGVISIISWFILNFIKEFEKSLIEKKRKENKTLDITTLDAVSKLLKASVFITAGLIIMQTLGFSISGILAFGGVGGVAVGFAAKDLLANFFGALMVYLDRPFAVGDWIRSSDRNIEGTVEHIGWRQTRIRTFDKRPLYVPNSLFSNITVENASRMSNRRIFETIGVRYDDIKAIDKIVRDIRIMLQNHPEIDTSQTLIVNFTEFAASSLNFIIYAFTKTTDWVKFHEIKENILLKIAAIIDKHNAQIAFPTRTLNLTEPTIVSKK